ncbi:MAG: alpha/beta fold hydrolase [Sulfuricaulis sp.]|uniref:alpha/beta hydrolase n=1 Tax=Sulfuricaulis sp. TaxID=2003553 RepID=UPI003C36DAA5
MLLIVMLSAGLLGCSGMFFFPYRGQVLSPEQLGLKYEDVYFTASDGIRLHAWLLPAEGKALGTILFLHGNAENISTHIMSVRWLPAQGYNVFLLDYRGYGASEGEPSVEGVQEDVNAAMRTLLSRPDVNPDRLVVFGQSLGGSIAIYNVAHSPYRQHIRALAVESAFASYRQIAREKLADFWLTWPLQYPLSWTVSDAYSPSDAVAGVSPIPLLVIHGDHDAIVPLHHGQRLYELAREPKQLWVVPGGGHIQAFQYQTYRDRFVAYLTEVLQESPAGHK